VDGRWETVCRVVNALRRFRIGVSWGGVESLVIAPKPRATSLHPLPAGLIRLSVGLEGIEALSDDLHQALSLATVA
jgi:cystathionine beta-lyase/cystathionine gamma-synthase